MPSPQYSLDYFKNNATLYKLAEKYDGDKVSGGNNDRILNGKEVSLFMTELKNKGINFDFAKIKDGDYLAGVDKDYNKEVKNAEKRQNLIKELKNDYDIVPYKDANGNNMYRITVKKDVKVGAVSKDLKLNSGVIADNNFGYGQYDGPNGSHISNKEMKGQSFSIPERELAARKGLVDIIVDLFN